MWLGVHRRFLHHRHHGQLDNRRISVVPRSDVLYSLDSSLNLVILDSSLFRLDMILFSYSASISFVPYLSDVSPTSIDSHLCHRRLPPHRRNHLCRPQMPPGAAIEAMILPSSRSPSPVASSSASSPSTSTASLRALLHIFPSSHSPSPAAFSSALSTPLLDSLVGRASLL